MKSRIFSRELGWSLGMINDDCVRVAHFLHDLIDNRDYLVTKDELCDIKFVTME